MTSNAQTNLYTKEHYIKQMAYMVSYYLQHQVYPLNEIVVDNFAGGGGASTGIEMAFGRPVDIAINHDIAAILMHRMNHPNTKHFCDSVWDLDPLQICKGRPVGLAWFSPDCKHFSKAKGRTPVEKKIRGLAWVTLRWAALVRPRVIMLENVEEFQTWGPLQTVRDKKTGRCLVIDFEEAKRKKNHKNRIPHRVAEPGEVVPDNLLLKEPDPKRKGETFKKFKKQLEDLGYVVEFRELIASDYGAPTKRKRFFMIARCDGQSIVWPEKTHSKDSLTEEEIFKSLCKRPREEYAASYQKILARKARNIYNKQRYKPWVPVSTCLDFTDLGKSIFDRDKPLAESTMARIAGGMDKFVFKNPKPFIIQVNHSGESFRGQGCDDSLPTLTEKNGFGMVTPYIMQIGQTGFTKDRNKSVLDPLTTIVSKNEHCFVTPMLLQYHAETSKTPRGQAVTDPLSTIDSSNRYAFAATYLTKFYKTGYGQNVTEPLHTITTSPGHFGEVKIVMLDTKELKYIRKEIREKANKVSSFIIEYYGQGIGQSPDEPLHTIVSKDRFALITVYGIDYVIVDITLRMLKPSELYKAQGFPEDYIIDKDYTGRKYPISQQVARVGNSVVPVLAEALAKANCPELIVGKRVPNMKIDYSKEQYAFAI